MLQVNLVPWRKMRGQRLSRYWLRLFACALAVILSGALCLAAVVSAQTTLLQLYLSVLNTDVRQLSLQQRRVDTAFAQVNVLRAERLISHQRVQRSLDDLQLLALLATQIPEEVWLTDLTEHQALLTLKGGGRFYHDILTFSQILSASGLLDEVRLSDVQQQPGQILTFVMKARLRQADSLAAQKETQ